MKKNLKALLLTWENFQDQEVVYPYYRLREETTEPSDVKILANKKGKIHGIMGVNMEAQLDLEDLKLNYGLYLDDYQLLVLPGGVKSLEKLRQESIIIDFIKDWNKKIKYIASTCHGAQLLISAGCLKGRKASGYYSIKDDIVNAGGLYVDSPFVVDNNLITSPHYNWMGEWMSQAISLARKKYNLG